MMFLTSDLQQKRMDVLGQKIRNRVSDIWARAVMNSAVVKEEGRVQIDLLFRLSMKPTIAQLFSGNNVADTLEATCGTDPNCINLLLDYYHDIRTNCFNGDDDWQFWVNQTAGVYDGIAGPKSMLPSTFTKSLGNKDSAKAILEANPWIIVFIYFPQVPVSRSVERKYISLKIMDEGDRDDAG